MQDPERVVGEFVEPCAESLLAEGAGVPRVRGLRGVADGEDEPAELGVLAADAILARGPATLELTASRCPGNPRIHGLRSGGRRTR